MISQYLRSVQLSEIPYNSYPFSLKAIKSLKELHFHPKVTYIIGENGTGKSTLLEAIAIAYGFNPEGGSINIRFSTENSHSVLSQYIDLVKGIKRPETGYFLRAESFYNVASYIDQVDRAGGLGPPIIASYGGKSLHEQSHGESFMALVLNRFSENGIYILDEPEAALSPIRQLALLSRMDELINKGCQFIIATHSPIVMGYPDASIFSVDDGLNEILYEDTEHFQVMKTFIEDREAVLKHLINRS